VDKLRLKSWQQVTRKVVHITHFCGSVNIHHFRSNLALVPHKRRIVTTGGVAIRIGLDDSSVSLMISISMSVIFLDAGANPGATHLAVLVINLLVITIWEPNWRDRTLANYN